MCDKGVVAKELVCKGVLCNRSRHTPNTHKHNDAHKAQTHASTKPPFTQARCSRLELSFLCASREPPDAINLDIPDNDEDDGNDNTNDDATTSTTTAPAQTPTPQLAPAVADRHAAPHGPSGNMCACPCPRACTLANTQTQTHRLRNNQQHTNTNGSLTVVNVCGWAKVDPRNCGFQKC